MIRIDVFSVEVFDFRNFNSIKIDVDDVMEMLSSQFSRLLCVLIVGCFVMKLVSEFISLFGGEIWV